MSVHGLERLRVVDASAMPYVTNGNIYAPVVMLAEKAADLIRGNVATGAIRTPSSIATSTSRPRPSPAPQRARKEIASHGGSSPLTRGSDPQLRSHSRNLDSQEVRHCERQANGHRPPRPRRLCRSASRMAGRSAIPGTSITYTNVVSDTKSSVADGGGVVDLLPRRGHVGWLDRDWCGWGERVQRLWLREGVYWRKTASYDVGQDAPEAGL